MRTVSAQVFGELWSYSLYDQSWTLFDSRDEAMIFNHAAAMSYLEDDKHTKVLVSDFRLLLSRCVFECWETAISTTDTELFCHDGYDAEGLSDRHIDMALVIISLRVVG